MSIETISPPFPLYSDSNGNELNNGSIFIGEENKDPETNPITVFWDSALSQPASQPIKTVNGYLSRAGSPARIYTSIAYSITVRDKSDKLVYTSLSSDFLISTNASNVIFDPAGVSAVPTTVEKKLRERVTFKDLGAVGDGVADDTAAINAILGLGGRITFSGGTYKTTDRLLVTVPGTHIHIESNVTLNMDGYAYGGTQSPFGNLIHITADNCSVTGEGASSFIQLGVTDGNAIGFLHCDGGYVGQLRMDGNKANNPGISDDTFQSGISIVNTVDSNPGGVGRFTVDNVTIENFTQYGINVFGDLCKDITLNDVRSYTNGITADANSVGAGIVCTFGMKNLTITNCKLNNNKTRGLFVSSAGKDASGMTITGNHMNDNGLHGIAITEEANFGSDSGVGIQDITITGNTCKGNTTHGILIGTFNDVGFVKNATVTGNTCVENGSFGILIQTNGAKTGTHDGAGNASVLTDSGELWATNTLIGLTISNTTDGSSGVITANTGTTITATLSGGTDDDWDVSDAYSIPLANQASDITVTGNIANDNVTGIGVGADIDHTVLINDNVSEGNSSANYSNSGSPSGLSTAWTPTVVGSGTDGTATYVTATGTYVRRGNKIEYSFVLDYNTFTGTTNLEIGGLPYPASPTEPANIAAVWANGLTLTGTLMSRTTANNSTLALDAINNGTFTAVAVDATATIRGSGFYRIEI